MTGLYLIGILVGILMAFIYKKTSSLISGFIAKESVVSVLEVLYGSAWWHGVQLLP